MPAVPGRSASPRPSRRSSLTACVAASSVQADGGIRTGRDVVIAALLGADEMGFCDRAAHCRGLHHDAQVSSEHLSRGRRHPGPGAAQALQGRSPSMSSTISSIVAEEVRELMAAMGVRRFDELIGMSEYLDKLEAIDHWKAKGLDFTRVFEKPRGHRQGRRSAAMIRRSTIFRRCSTLNSSPKRDLRSLPERRSRLKPRSPMSIAPSGPCSRAKSPGAMAIRACPRTRSVSRSPASPARASAPSWRMA